MKKILQSVGFAAAILFATGANAQLPDYGVWPSGVTFTDINSNTYDCDAILDAGQSIIIDAFADWCGPCWSYHTGGTLENVYNSVGNGGTGDVFIIGIEADPSVPESYISNSGTGQGDWTLGGTLDYPLANDNALAGIINLAYYPTLILICPDRTVTEVGQVSQSAWETAIGNCGAASTNSNDPRILSSTTSSTIQVCGSTTGTTDITVVIQNFSNSAISGNYDIDVDDGSTVVASTTATLNLAPYDVQEVNVGAVSLNIGTNNFTATITTANDNTSNDVLAIPVDLEAAADVEVNSGLDLQIVMDIDNYPTEVGYALREGTPASNDPSAVWTSSNAGNSVIYVNNGSISSSSYSTNITLNTLGCHYLVTYDSYGDGITYAYPSGHAELNGMTSLSIPGDWGSGAIFGVNFIAGVEVAPVTNFSASQTTVTEGTVVTFTDLSTNGPTAWAWTITPGTGWSYSGGTNAGSQNPQVLFSTPGVYTVELTASNSGGSDTDTKTDYITVIVDDSGIKDADALSGLTIFPNPASDLTNIQLNLSENANVSIEIINSLGQVVVSESLGNITGMQNVEINTSDLQEGLYLVNVKVNDDIVTERISVIK